MEIINNVRRNTNMFFLIGTTGVSRRPALFDIFKPKQKTDAKKQPSIMKQVKAAVQVILSVDLVIALKYTYSFEFKCTWESCFICTQMVKKHFIQLLL